jgi:hypothetical protein
MGGPGTTSRDSDVRASLSALNSQPEPWGAPGLPKEQSSNAVFFIAAIAVGVFCGVAGFVLGRLV